MENYVILNGLVPDFNSMSLSKKTVIVKNQIIEDVLEPNSLTTFNNQYKKIDVNGNILSFGFIDVHSHSDLATFSDKNSNPKIKQGVTTEIIGNCGLSVYPYNGFIDWKNRFSSVWGFPEIEWNWSSVSDYIEKTKNRGKNEVFPSLVMEHCEAISLEIVVNPMIHLN